MHIKKKPFVLFRLQLALCTSFSGHHMLRSIHASQNVTPHRLMNGANTAAQSAQSHFQQLVLSSDLDDVVAWDRSIHKGNFLLHVEALNRLRWLFHSLHHDNYAQAIASHMLACENEQNNCYLKRDRCSCSYRELIGTTKINGVWTRNGQDYHAADGAKQGCKRILVRTVGTVSTANKLTFGQLIVLCGT